MKSKRILLLSAYDARSHRFWREQLVSQFGQHDWVVLTLKDRFFAWRMGGNALNFKAEYNDLLQADYDLLIATSMKDLATLRGMYPHLAKIPNLLYFHENQFAYPVNHKQQGLKEIQMRSLYSAMVADQITFNSEFNRDSFFAGLSGFIKQMPDGIPNNLENQLAAKSTVLAVPLADDCQPNRSSKTSIKPYTEVVWNHRWEHDKGPETLLKLLYFCQHKSPTTKPIRFHIIGQQFREQPATMQTIKEQHSDQCLSLGFIESRDQYLKILQSADVVLSTALHDFQGLAVLEAAACGCLPLVPDRLVYPELYPDSNRYNSTPGNPKKEAQAIYQKLQKLDQLQTADIRCHWQDLHAAYTRWLDS